MASRITGASIGSQTIRATLAVPSKPLICIQCQISRFSTTPSQAGPNGDRNKKRGVSALRRTGPKHPSAVSREPLPRPVTDPERRSKIKVNEKHGLWQFFDKDKKAFEAPEVVAEHGRSWTVHELRFKSFEDIHCLWWVCVKERNRLITQEHERKKVDAGFGQQEFEDRDEAVRRTMRAIKHVLTERWYSWEDARKLAAEDPQLQNVLTGEHVMGSVEESAFEDEEPSSTNEEKGMFDEQQPALPEPPVPERQIVQEPLR